jgi:hypothetical protein
VTATVVTACFGGYDTLRPQVDQDVDVDWVAFTDDVDLAGDPWRVEVRRAPVRHPRMAAKVYKLAPPVQGDVVWIDANTEITDSSFVRRALAARRNGIAVFRHPDRDCVYEEAAASLRLCPEKYSGQPILEQVERYRAEGHPAHGGLYACGTIAWDQADDRALAVAARWWAEIERWSYQDQLSLPVVLRRLGLEPGILPARQTEKRGRGWIGNRWQRIWPHLSAA